MSVNVDEFCLSSGCCEKDDQKKGYEYSDSHFLLELHAISKNTTLIIIIWLGFNGMSNYNTYD